MTSNEMILDDLVAALMLAGSYFAIHPLLA
jgi:hypothetical protein